MTSQSKNTNMFDNSIDSITMNVKKKDCVSNLKMVLENVHSGFQPEVLLNALEECFSAYALEFLDEKVFSQILPVAHRTLNRVIREINTTLGNAISENVISTVKEKLFHCKSILDLYKKSMDFIINLHNVPVICIKSIPDILPESIKLIFDHCKISMQSYGSFFSDLTADLTHLFCSANEVLKLFLVSLDGIIAFDVNNVSEMQLLVKVIEVIGIIAARANGMDLKTFVGTLACFGKLAITYRENIKEFSAKSVTLPLQYVIKETSSIVLMIQESYENVEERVIKGIIMILKHIVKLSVAYLKFLNNDILLVLFELLLRLHGFYSFNLQSHNKIIETMNPHILNITESLLNVIFKNDNFMQIYFEYGNQRNIDRLYYHLLTLTIMKMLIVVSKEERCKWISNTKSILDVSFENLNYLQKELCIGKLQLFGIYNLDGEPSKLYEVTLISICKIVCYVPSDSFNNVERLLLKNLLSNQFWNSLLSSDVWCFIGRYVPTNLCTHHVKYLMKVYVSLSSRSNNQGVIRIKNLIRRLYALLPENTRHTIVVESLNDVDARFWMAYVHFLPNETQQFLHRRIICDISNISNIFANLYRQPNAQYWMQLIKLLPMVGIFSDSEEKEAVETLAKLWNFIAITIENCDDRSLRILSDLSVILLNGSQAKNFSNETYIMILRSIAMSSLYVMPYAKIQISYYLRNVVNQFEECDVRTSCALAELNCSLLEDENPWVRQESLESFDHIAQRCTNDDLIARLASAVSKKSTINNFVSAYLSSAEYYNLQDFPSIESYFCYIVTRNTSDVGLIKHTCLRSNDIKRDEKIPRTESNNAFENNICVNDSVSLCTNDLDQSIDDICEKLHEILERKKNIGYRSLRKLRIILEKLVE